MRKNQPDITVYAKPMCVQCDATKRDLTRHGLRYQLVDVTTDEEALERIKDLGYKQAPVVIAGDDHWSGFRPDKIKALDPGSGRTQSLSSAAPRSRITL